MLPAGTSALATADDGAQAALASLWAQHEEAILGRVGVLERAVAALVRGAIASGAPAARAASAPASRSSCPSSGST